MEELQWGFPIATPLSLNKLISINDKKKWWRLKSGLAKRRALFPEGRGLGVGGRKNYKKESKREKKETHPAQWDGLEGIDNRVGIWRKKVKAKAHGLRSMGILFLNDAS